MSTTYLAIFITWCVA